MAHEHSPVAITVRVVVNTRIVVCADCAVSNSATLDQDIAAAIELALRGASLYTGGKIEVEIVTPKEHPGVQ